MFPSIPRNSLNGSSQLRNSQEISSDQPARKVSLLARPFRLGWRDRNKGNPSSAGGEVGDAKPADEVQKRIVMQQQSVNGHQQEDAKQ
ncbi:hypothetical protein AKJ16_DCAP23804 [Drosera capensis]